MKFKNQIRICGDKDIVLGETDHDVTPAVKFIVDQSESGQDDHEGSDVVKEEPSQQVELQLC